MFTAAQLQHLAGPFGMAAGGLEPLGGSQNHVFRGTHASGREGILRISAGRHRTKPEVEAELAWVSHLAGSGVRVCKPLLSEEGEGCAVRHVEGRSCLVTCFEPAPGRRVEKGDLTPALYEKLGALLGQMHAGAVSFDLGNPDWDRPRWHESRLIRQDLDALGDALSGGFRRSVKDLVGALREATVDSSICGPVHGDVSFGNCHLHEGDLWIYDFDNAERGCFVQDLATVLYDSVYCKVLDKFADDGLTERMVPLWQAVWKGYATTGVLKARDLDGGLLQKFFLLREAVIYGHYHRVFDVRTVNDSFKAGLEVMRWNVERQQHQVDFAALGGDFRLADTGHKT